MGNKTTKTMRVLLDTLGEQRNDPAGSWILPLKQLPTVERWLNSFHDFHDRTGVASGAQSGPSKRKEREQLRTENAQLRAERVTLQSENEQLRAELEAAKQAAKPVEIKIGDTVRLKDGAKSVYGTPLFVVLSYVVDNALAEGRELQIRQAKAEPGSGGWWVARDQIAEVIR